MSNIDKSLDEIIKTNRPVRKGRGSNRSNRSTPYSKKGGKGSDSRRVYVGNLTWATGWGELKDFMRSAGDVVRADVFEHPDGRSKGCGVVEYKTPAGAKNAIKTLHDEVLDGRPIFVREDREARGVGQNTGNGQSGGFSNGFDQPMFSPNSNLAQKIRNKAPPGCTVYIGNLPWSAEWQELKDVCSKFGDVARADVEQNEDGRSKGYGIAVFETKKGAAKCIRELDGATFGDRELTVKLDKIRASGQTYNNNKGGSFRSVSNKKFGKFTLSAPGSGRMKFGGGANKKVYVGNLPWSVEWQDLKDLCKQYGNVIRADVQVGDDGRSRGFGLVSFANARDANNCINNLHGMLLDGRDLNVRWDRD